MGQSHVVSVRVYFLGCDFREREVLSDSDLFVAHEALAVVDFAEPDSGLLFGFVSAFPDTVIDVEFVVGEHDPPPFSDEFDSVEDVIYVIVVEEPW